MDVLFISKKYYSYEDKNAKTSVPHGLQKAAWFTSRFLNSRNFDTKDISISDADEIDKIVTEHNPKIVIIEALWVTPEKMRELMEIPAHRKRLWMIRIHSQLSFLANEGIALDWLDGYRFDNVIGCANTRAAAKEMREMLGADTMYLPTIYNPPEYQLVHKNYNDGVFRVGCFGAIRPLKNHIVQAVASIKLANKLVQPLEFHINAQDVEKSGVGILRNLEKLFDVNPQHKLVKHPWLPHKEFTNLIRTMDLGTQVSLSESFNIVAADFISQRIPIVVSNAVEWAPKEIQVRANADSDEVARYMYYVWRYYTKSFYSKCERALDFHNAKAKEIWVKLCNKIRK